MDYLHFLQSLDIGLAVDTCTEYNRRCRSDAKFLEYAAAGVAGIYADLQPYRDSVVHGETGLLYRTSADLWGCLDRLYCGNAPCAGRIRRPAEPLSTICPTAPPVGAIPRREALLAWYRRLTARYRRAGTPPFAGDSRHCDQGRQLSAIATGGAGAATTRGRDQGRWRRGRVSVGDRLGTAPALPSRSLTKARLSWHQRSGKTHRGAVEVLGQAYALWTQPARAPGAKVAEPGSGWDDDCAGPIPVWKKLFALARLIFPAGSTCSGCWP